MKIDKYYWRAQYLPAVLTSLPLMMVFDEVLLHSNWWRPSADILAFMKFAPAAFSAGLSFWMTQVNAYISKQLFQAKPEFLPTTYRILYSNSLLGRKTKKELHQKIVTDFGVKLLTEQQELADPVEARKIIASVVPRIRLKMRKDVFVRRRNISYGFCA
ncbi:hypothetical protein [Spirosoma endophyticum]|uniref:Uncharacterized protein n=1 Tax=Spirosoma endophyticum TaxID=662367 RepID=A0A1I2FEV3_9BACT|nr:hypothetical protein [Spirosoma endophyticum]SFF03100.1 hypothetical protein SAMN05216167_12548 [Spirosoma endophyticum]